MRPSLVRALVRFSSVTLLAIALPAMGQTTGGAPPSQYLVRVVGGAGRATQSGSWNDLEGGVELMLTANDFQRYGLHLSSLDLRTRPQRQRYLCAGYVLEMVLFQWLRAEIGTVGFIGRGEQSGQNPFGLLCVLGYEKRVGSMNYSIGYDSKTIFTKPAITISNLSLGAGLHF